ncbi:hypothetical protein T11_16937 [Trichinella zimbabwensis]|uniref:Uncharacterized protein n=1 Tax=Trichinella zimbabwensis TaxID=268475 RepID=A0A0V1GCU8_9BILA|nr:hypothetical protein T11_16937 [Trichinella zimbabwensis]
MSRMFPLLKCRHPGCVSREFHMGCFLVYSDRHGANFRSHLFHKHVNGGENLKKNFSPKTPKQPSL